MMQGPAGPFALHTAAAAELARTSKGRCANFQRWSFGFCGKALSKTYCFPIKPFKGLLTLGPSEHGSPKVERLT